MGKSAGYKVRGEKDEVVFKGVVYKDVVKNNAPEREYFCLTEDDVEKVSEIKDFLSVSTDKESTENQYDECPEEGLPTLEWNRLFEPSDRKAPLYVPWAHAKKAFAFLKSASTVVGEQHWGIPKPMTTPFKDMQLQQKAKVQNEEGEDVRDENNDVKWKNTGEKIDVPAAIRSFFAFQVDTTPASEEAARVLIEERNIAADNRVAGQYGSLFLKGAGREDDYLNQVDQINNEHFDREHKVNNPRELIQMIEAANKLNYQELLNFSAAKLASGIRINDLWRLRALFGFSPTGDYTDKTYKVSVSEDPKEDQEVAGYFDTLDKNKWYVPSEDKNALHFSKTTVEDAYLEDTVKNQYTKIHDNEAVMRGIVTEDYQQNWTEAKDMDGNLICVRNALIV